MFYLLNKIFFSRAERSQSVIAARRWRIASWAVYLLGLPPWLIIFVSERNWIAAGLEAGGTPAMLLGLIIALRGKGRAPRWLDYVALLAITVGIIYSLKDFGGLNTINQYLELGLTLGFLVGTYQLAKEKPQGYLWFILMNLSCGSLMAVQHYYWLMLQQMVSLGFVIDAYRTQKHRADQTDPDRIIT
ncbi:nicotinamide mononucleotide transporter [Patescibacteria group bacterium]